MLENLIDVELEKQLGLDSLNVLTFLLLGFWAACSLNRMAKGERHSIFFPIIVNFIFCGLPPLLDVLVGKPEYPPTVNGIYEPTRDDFTNIIYCLTVIFATAFFWYFGRSKKIEHQSEIDDLEINFEESIPKPVRPSIMQKFLLVLSFLILIMPIIAWLTSPNPGLYSTYGVGSGGIEFSASFMLSKEEYEYYNFVISPLTQLSLVGAVVMIALQTQFNSTVMLFILPFLLASSWLNGKRNIPVMMAFVLIYLFWEKGWLRGKKFIASCFSLLLAFMLFSHFYQMNVRNLEQSTDSDEYYTSLRVDFGRDHTIKMAIHAELNPERPILQYRGQSCLFYPTLFIPRSVWPDKPVNYAIYVSQAAIEKASLFGFEGWVLTTSILDEAIANFSWLGIIIGPLIVCLVCRVGDACENPFISALTNLNATLFLVIDMSAFWPLFLLWLIGVFTLRLTTPRQRAAYH
jgi:hypothetical protein